MEPNVEKYSNRRRMKKYVFGIIVILIGLLLLSRNTGQLPPGWMPVVFSWQMLLIGIGVISLFGKDSYIPGIILILIGGIFIIPKFGVLPFSVHSLFWPAILIAIGLIILFKGFGRRQFQHRPEDRKLEDGYIHEETIFGGTKQRVTHQQFRGGKISCIFGGAEVDLSLASLAPGEHTLEISAIFGGATVIVPSDWKIIIKNSSFLGGFEDKRRLIKESSDPSRVLIIQAEAIFGGGEIKSY
jgi:predicted membrane protein